MFKDPRTVDQADTTIQAQWYLVNTWMHKTKLYVQDRSKLGEFIYQNKAEQDKAEWHEL